MQLEPAGRGVARPDTRALRALQNAVADARAELAGRLAMHPTDLAAMEHVAAADGALGPGELAERLGISPSAVTELVDRLERAGHLDRARDPADRRRVRLQPTPSALDQVLRELGALLSALDAVAGRFTADERRVVLRFLDEATAAYRTFGGGSGQPGS